MLLLLFVVVDIHTCANKQRGEQAKQCVVVVVVLLLVMSLCVVNKPKAFKPFILCWFVLFRL